MSEPIELNPPTLQKKQERYLEDFSVGQVFQSARVRVEREDPRRSEVSGVDGREAF